MEFLSLPVGMVRSGRGWLVLCSRCCPARETPRGMGFLSPVRGTYGQVRGQVFRWPGLPALLWLSGYEVDSLCEHVIAAQQ